MRKINKLKTIILLVLLLLPTLAFGQKVEFTRPYKYTTSNDDSRNSAKAKAMEEAQAALFQEIGVLVEARQKMTTTASGNNTRQDFFKELKTYTVSKVQTTVVAGTEKFTDNEKGGMVYSATFSMLVDTADLYRYLDNIVKQKEQERLAEIKKQQKIERLRKEIEELKTQLEIAKGKENDVLGPFLTAQKRLDELKIQKDDAEQSYRSTTNAANAATPAGIAKTKNAADYLTQTTNQYNAQEVEYKKVEKAMSAVQRDVNKARDNLYNAEILLANETEAPKPERPKYQIPEDTKINNNTTHTGKNADIYGGSSTSETKRTSYEIQREENALERFKHYRKMKNLATTGIIVGAVVGTTGIALYVEHSAKASDYIYFSQGGYNYFRNEADEDNYNKENSKSSRWFTTYIFGYSAVLAGIPFRAIGRVKSQRYKNEIPTVYVIPNGVKLLWDF